MPYKDVAHFSSFELIWNSKDKVVDNSLSSNNELDRVVIFKSIIAWPWKNMDEGIYKSGPSYLKQKTIKYVAEFDLRYNMWPPQKSPLRCSSRKDNPS